ncbi:MAG: hypothetical protein ACOZNI_09410 [Myxococcota bacterium]
MASKYFRLLPPTALTASYKQSDTQVVDCGAYNKLEIYLKMLKAGPAAGTVFISHNATLDADNWKAIPGASMAQNGTDSFLSVDHFLRYIRVEGNGSGDGTGIALADVVAKE